jgi:transcriptional regulator with XRE-family HTH domain
VTAHTALGAYLRKHREECGDDLAVVAARLGLPKRVVEDFERGEKMPSKEEGMRALAACYRLSYGKVESLWNPSRADRRAAVEPRNLDLGANIRRMRQARGLSQAQLAMAASTSQGNISLLELGLRNPAPELTQRVLAILEAEPANA